jgi:hypothetical protein
MSQHEMTPAGRDALSPGYEQARLAGLRAIGCKPENHPQWWTAFDHKRTVASLHQRHEESLTKWRPDKVVAPPGVEPGHP